MRKVLMLIIFLSTFPRRERRQSQPEDLRYQTISIHVPTQGTTCYDLFLFFLFLFLSTFPRRERPGLAVHPVMSMIFLSTFPRRERQRIEGYAEADSAFLSTFPRRERPLRLMLGDNTIQNFYPRSHVGNDVIVAGHTRYKADFYPRSHVGNDTMASRTLH